ncbi:MAG: GGDEF domain-containing protein [Acidimicrobiales bacterium]
MNERRALLALCGAALGVAGAAASVAGARWGGVLAGLGALLAAAVVVFPLRRGPGVEETLAAEPEILPPIVPPVAEDALTAESEAPAVDQAERLQTAPPAPPVPPPATPAPPSPPNANALLTDPETGLFSEEYFDIAIDARIAAARRHLRPVGVVILEVVEGLREGDAKPTDPTKVAEAILTTLREADTACRRSSGHFALLLEDTPENGAIWTVERIRRHMAENDSNLTLWAGVACYPAHGFSSDSLMAQASDALDGAREWRQDRIEVAAGE